MSKKIQDEIKILSEKIIQHNNDYYIYNSPSISDAEYDQLFHRLKTLEEKYPEFATPDSPTKTIGAKIQDKFNKYEHKVPMLSLDNTFSEEDVLEFINKIKRFLSIDYFPSIFCEPKIDGVSFSVTYKNGNLNTGATRGDGYIGEDITENIKTIKLLPHKIENAPDLIEIRGEIYIDKIDFENINKLYEENGNTKFANPRNFAAGSLRQLDSNVTARRHLKYFVYSVGYCSENFSDTQSELLQKLETMGFVVNPIQKLCKSIAEILEFYNKLLNQRKNLSYEIDGAVYKVNSFALQDRLGFIARSPRFATAHKFPALIAETELLDINVQVGRTGILTPVAELKTINISGVNVSRATLHNFQEIERLDIRIGDTVLLYRAGDVIPKISGVNKEKRHKDARKFIIPDKCPSCNTKLHIDPEEILIRCDNGLNCPKQLGESITHFVSKNGMNIDGIGEKQVEFLLEKNMIKNPVDIFHLKELNNSSITKLENMPGWGEKSVQNLFNSIEEAKSTTLPRFIYALGIRNIGEENAKILAKEFISAKGFFHAMTKLGQHDEDIFNRLDSLDGIGNKMITDIIIFFECPVNVTTIESLIDILDIQDFVTDTKPGLLSGKNVIFTGSLTSLSRSEAKSQAEKLGAKVVSAVSANTDLVIVGENPGSKLKKATELGIKVISQQEWLKMLEKDQ